MNPEKTPTPAKKRGRPAKSSIIGHTDDDTGIIPPKPPHDFSRGEKTPTVIRWRRDYHPETMAGIYRGWNWQAYLDSNPAE